MFPPVGSPKVSTPDLRASGPPQLYPRGLPPNVHFPTPLLTPTQCLSGHIAIRPGEAWPSLCLGSAWRCTQKCCVGLLRSLLKEKHPSLPSSSLECRCDSCSLHLLLNHEIARQRWQRARTEEPGSPVAITNQGSLGLLLQTFCVTVLGHYY